ncbi:hydroxyacid dehydrogenase [Alicyclobacillus kakegawensis]|uniref:hydroxyacid dehydrogenase n=1 Tax=Alicyclobacillus kakegawensis TaxID=392012 RepID=UPI0008322C67|nr:hydroxyacid dehydrogenase [Alicyclobacillus kakegawensis]
MPSRIVISEDLWVNLPEGFGNGRTVVYDPSLVGDRQRLLRLGPDTEALIVRNQTRVDEELLENFPNLRIVGRLGVGLDNIDLTACQRRGIPVVSARGFNANAVAEYVMACLLQHVRPLFRWNEAVRRGAWDRMAAMGEEVYGKTLGLIGIGDIGQRVATRARAMGLTVVAYDPFILPSHSVVRDVGVALISLDDLLRSSHFVSVHVPLTDTTRHLLNGPALAKMREDSVLINTSRGGIVDEDALAEVLVNFPTRFAYLDVRSTEPPGPDDRLRSLDNVCLTPHIAGITVESSHEVAWFVLTQVMEQLEGRKAMGIVP